MEDKHFRQNFYMGPWFSITEYRWWGNKWIPREREPCQNYVNLETSGIFINDTWSARDTQKRPFRAGATETEIARVFK